MENNENSIKEVRVTPKDFFLNLGWVATLYGSVISLLNLLFETINRVFPDMINQYYSGIGYSAGIRWAIAWLIVMFPIYIFLTRYLRKIYAVEPIKKEIWVRKWFVYLTLFLSSATVIVDLVVVINSFLGGELTTRFLFKVIATFLVAVVVFGYYFYDLRGEGISNRTGKIFAIGAAVFVLASLVWAFAVIGSPMKERLMRFDDIRVQNLQDIQWRVINYWQNNGKVPDSIENIENNLTGMSLPIDPKTQASYEFKKNSGTSFVLCANFDLPSRETGAVKTANDYWAHGQGKVCFDRNIDVEQYPVNPKIMPAQIR